MNTPALGIWAAWIGALLLHRPVVQALRDEQAQSRALDEEQDSGTGTRAKDQCTFHNLKELGPSEREKLASAEIVTEVCKDSIGLRYARNQLSNVGREQENPTLGMVAIDDHTKEICGFTYGYVTDEHSYHTSLICSHMGYGKKLLGASIKWAQEKGIELADLDAIPEALGFYRKQNYVFCKDACEYRCDDTSRFIDNVFRMSRCIKDRSESTYGWGPGTVDLSTRLSSGEAGGERFLHVNGRRYRCCCKKEAFCEMVDVTDKFHFPVSLSTSTCGRYIRDSHAWNSHKDPLENSCVVWREDIPQDLLPELGDLLSKLDSTGEK